MIEDFQRELANERAAELRTHLERIGGSAPPKHLTVLRGTLHAYYDDGIDIEANLEFEAVAVERPKKSTLKQFLSVPVLGGVAGGAVGLLLVDWLSSGNPVINLKQAGAVAVLAVLSFYCGFNWRRK